MPDLDAMIHGKGKQFARQYESVRWVLDDVIERVEGTLVSNSAYERWESRGRDDDALLDEVMPQAVEHIRDMVDALAEEITEVVDEDDPDAEDDEYTSAARAWLGLGEREQAELIQFGLADMILDEACGLAADDDDDE